MMSIKRQCSEAVALLAAIQACTYRTEKGAYRNGISVIPCRAEDFAVYIERARALLGVDEPRRRS